MASNEQLVREIVLRARDDASRTITRFDSVLSGMGLTVGNLERQFLSLPSAIGIGLSAGAVVGLGKHLLDLGDNLSDISDRTGVSIGVLGGLRPMLEQDGTSVEAFAKGISKAQKALGLLNDDSPGVAQNLKLIGLSVDELRRLSPDEFLEKFARGLATVENRNDRMRIATDLFSKSAAELIPTLLRIAETGLPRLSKEAEAGFKALGKLKDALVGATAEAVNFWAALFGQITGALSFSEIDIVNRQIENLSGMLVGMKIRMGDAFEVDPKMIELQLWLTGLQVRLEKLASAPKPAIQKLLGDPAEIKKAADAYRQFQEQLEKQLAGIGTQRAGLVGGPQAALAAQLDEQLRAFKDKLSADKLKPPAGLDEFFKKWKGFILDANNELGKTKLLLDQLGAGIEQSDLDFGAAKRSQREQENADIVRLREQIAAAERAALEAATGGPEGDDFFIRFKESLDGLNESMNQQSEAEGKLQDSLHSIDREAALMGTEFDSLTAKINLYKEAILSLPAGSEKIAGLRTELEKLKNDKTIEDFATGLGASISQGINQTIEGITQGTQTLEQGLKNMLRNVFLKISQEILEKEMLKPLETALKTALTDIIGTAGGSGAGGTGGGLFDVLSSSLKNIFTQLFSGVSGWMGGLFGGGSGGAQAGMGIIEGITQMAAKGAIFPGHFNPVEAFAGGGVVNRPTFGFIGENSRPEAVVPLPDGRSIPVRMAENRAAPSRPLHLTMVFDYSNAIDPRGLKTTKEEIVRHIVDDVEHDGMVRRVIMKTPRG